MKYPDLIKLDSNALNSKIDWVCQPCGRTALKLPENAHKKQFQVSTWHTEVCDVCGIKRAVTEVRDFGFPVFEVTRKKKPVG